ncbi:hypothetical protein ACP70R_049979 [Stipagrostis hirtigluma subsp. patula]
MEADRSTSSPTSNSMDSASSGSTASSDGMSLLLDVCEAVASGVPRPCPSEGAMLGSGCANPAVLNEGGHDAACPQVAELRGVTGPDARINPSESAITVAIRNAAGRGGGSIFYPSVGTTFNSCEEGRDFYNLYSWEVGFGVRYHRSKKNTLGYRTKVDITCSCEGHDKNRNTRSCRTGCRAMIRLLRTEDHGWYVSRIVDKHNHPLSEGCGEKKQWHSHEDIDEVTKDFVRKLRENNVSIGRVCNILGVSDGSSRQPLRKEVVRTLCAKVAQENIKDDIGKTIKLLDDMKSKDPSLQVRFQVDNEGRIKSMLWCSSKNRLDYAKFGDVVTFDTTYRTNLYNLPFGLFVGVNNHFQSVIFGGVLLTQEKTSDFVWAFKSFLDIMSENAPVTMLTDQCLAMKAALKKTMPNTRHRWCRWHVLKNAKEKLGYVYSKYGGFKNEFNALVTDVICQKEFETEWGRLVKKYKLEENTFMKRLFKKRAMWAKPYFMDVFCAGMTSTQRSESANHMLKSFIQRSSPMHMFVRKFNEFQYDRKDQECKENHVTKQKRRKLRVGVPIERHARTVYTRAMYERFNNELFEAGSFAIEEKKGDREFLLVDTRDDGKPNARKARVTLSESMEQVFCECGLYNHVGMLCRHALKVLVHLDSREIPSKNIMKRWTLTSPDVGVTSRLLEAGPAYAWQLSRTL